MDKILCASPMWRWLIILVILLTSAERALADLPATPPVPEGLSPQCHDVVNRARIALESERIPLNVDLNAQRSQCRAVPRDDQALIQTCSAWDQRLNRALDDYERRLQRYQDLRRMALEELRMSREMTNLEAQITGLTQTLHRRRVTLIAVSRDAKNIADGLDEWSSIHEGARSEAIWKAANALVDLLLPRVTESARGREMLAEDRVRQLRHWFKKGYKGADPKLRAAVNALGEAKRKAELISGLNDLNRAIKLSTFAALAPEDWEQLLGGISTVLSFGVKDPGLQLFLADVEIGAAAFVGWVKSGLSTVEMRALLDQQQRYPDMKEQAHAYVDLVDSLREAKRDRTKLATRMAAEARCSN